jgi:CheY-like chemotaxis protein/anti-anti-sigma regulatory factor
MESKIRKKDKCWIISYEGDTSDIMPGPLPEVIHALRDGAQEIVLNFSGLRYINPNGVKALRDSLEMSRKRAANIGIASPTAQVRRALKLSGLVPDFPLFFSERDALANIESLDYEDAAKADMVDRLLICQKERPLAGLLREALKNHPLKPHYRMIPCRDLDQAMNSLLEERVDCVLVDATFPLYSVITFIEKVETDNRLPAIPILIVAADNQLVDAEKMVRNGAHEILRFPFIPVEAVVRIQTLISHMKDHSPYIPPEKIAQPRGWRA